MKKLFIAVLAVAALASCAQDEVIGNYNRGIIGFSDTFVDNATKALYDNNSNKVSSFELYGTVKGTGTSNPAVAIYDAVTVEGTEYGKVWDQTEGTVQYWLPSCTYNFYAIVDATKINATGGVPTTIEYTATDGLKDLLYGAVTATTDDTAIPAGDGIITTTDGENVVAFTLNHLLSKVSFKFTSSVGAPYAFAITDLKLAGAYATGTYTINGEKWEGDGAMANPLAFSDIASVVTNTPTAAAESYVIIPGKPVLTITFNAVVSYNGTKVSTIPYTLTVNDPLNDKDTEQEFVKNTHYNFSITLPAPGKEIKFAVYEVGAFADGGDVNVQ